MACFFLTMRKIMEVSINESDLIFTRELAPDMYVDE